MMYFVSKIQKYSKKTILLATGENLSDSLIKFILLVETRLK